MIPTRPNDAADPVDDDPHGNQGATRARIAETVCYPIQPHCPLHRPPQVHCDHRIVFHSSVNLLELRGGGGADDLSLGCGPTQGEIGERATGSSSGMWHPPADGPNPVLGGGVCLWLDGDPSFAAWEESQLEQRRLELCASGAADEVTAERVPRKGLVITGAKGEQKVAVCEACMTDISLAGIGWNSCECGAYRCNACPLNDCLACGEPRWRAASVKDAVECWDRMSFPCLEGSVVYPNCAADDRGPEDDVRTDGDRYPMVIALDRDDVVRPE